MDRKALLIKALNAASESVEPLSDNRFRIGVNEYHVWTEAEADEFGYHAGGVDTTDAQVKVYRIF